MAKRKSIRLQPNHVADLKALKVLTKVIKNSKNPKWVFGTDEVGRIIAEKCNDTSELLTRAFNWENSPEEKDYWYEIYQRLRRMEGY